MRKVKELIERTNKISFESEKKKNIEQLKAIVKDIENGKIKDYQLVAFREDEDGCSGQRVVVGKMNPYMMLGVNESLAEEAKDRVKSQKTAADLSDLLGIGGMFGDQDEEDF